MTFIILVQRETFHCNTDRIRKGADKQEVWLSRARPPTSLDLSRVLKSKLKNFGTLLPSKKTGDVLFVICGMWVAIINAVYAESTY